MTAVCYKPSWYIGVALDRVPNEDRTVMASWTCTWADTANFEVFWRYGLQNGRYIDTTQSVSYIEDNATYQAKFTYPENATWVQVWVRPHERNEGTEDSKWKYLCPWSPGVDGVWFYVYEYATPKDIPTPEVSVDKYRVTATCSIETLDYDGNTTGVQFYVVDELGTVVWDTTIAINRTTSVARYVFDGTAGKKYKVAARGVNTTVPGGLYGKWSSYSSLVEMPPAGVSISKISALSSTSVSITVKVPEGDTKPKGIEVNYTSMPKEFETNLEGVGETKTFDNFSSLTELIIEGIETGKSWYFRIRGTNNSGVSAWSDVQSVLLGVKPSPPTTWSNTVTARIGETVRLNWTHNSRDGSGLQASKIRIYNNSDPSGLPITIDVPGVKDSDTQEWVNTGTYNLTTDQMQDGTVLSWQVSTRGVLDVYSDWSVTREIKLFAPPTLTVTPFKTQNSGDTPLSTLDSFPFYIIAQAGPSSQKAISFHISIVADKAYQKVDYNGETVWVNEGEIVYSHFFDFDSNLDVVEFDDYAVIQDNVLTLKLMPYDVDFENGQTYTIKATVAMDSGLSAEAWSNLSINWEDQELYPEADIRVDMDQFTAVVIPSCPIIPDSPDGMVEFEEEEGPDAKLPLVEDVLLSVYRREYDGRMTKIMDGIPNDRSSAVVDPHPSTDYARYRIVATDQTTGAIGYVDVESERIGQPGIVIQWDEEWQQSIFINPADGKLEGVAGWSGTMLTLPFNVQTSEGNKPDRATVEYIGQQHPTSYFGTQLGTTATWSSVIEKSDTERLELLRKLSIYQGNVYVRNSRGVGYWAIVDVSYNIDYGDEGDQLLIPITINVTRVRGGI